MRKIFIVHLFEAKKLVRESRSNSKKNKTKKHLLWCCTVGAIAIYRIPWVGVTVGGRVYSGPDNLVDNTWGSDSF